MIKRPHKIILLSIAIITMVLLFYNNAFFSPIYKDITILRSEISLLKEGLSQAKLTADNMDGLGISIASIKGEIQNKKSNLPDTLDSSDLITLLYGINDEIAAKNSLIFLAPIVGEDFTVVPVRFSFQTSHQGILDLLLFLNSLSIKPTITNMQITTSADNSMENLQNNMDETDKVLYNLYVEMTLNFYVNNEKSN